MIGAKPGARSIASRMVVSMQEELEAGSDKDNEGHRCHETNIFKLLRHGRIRFPMLNDPLLTYRKIASFISR